TLAHGTGTTVLTDKRTRCRRSRSSRTGRDRPRGGLFFPKKGFCNNRSEPGEKTRKIPIYPAGRTTPMNVPCHPLPGLQDLHLRGSLSALEALSNLWRGDKHREGSDLPGRR